MKNMPDKEIPSERREQLLSLAERIGVDFQDIGWLDQALTHSSYSNEVYGRKSLKDNERLEFLGDAVLETAVSSYLFDRYPHYPEGTLTKMRAATVCERTLSKRGIELGLGECLLLGKGEKKSSGSMRSSILEDAFEAVIGAVYKDRGWKVACDYAISQLEKEIGLLAHGQMPQDYKSELQELVQNKQHKNAVSYLLLEEDGPPHAKSFTVGAIVNEVEMGVGVGRSKKEAEQNAACEALAKMKDMVQWK